MAILNAGELRARVHEANHEVEMAIAMLRQAKDMLDTAKISYQARSAKLTYEHPAVPALEQAVQGIEEAMTQATAATTHANAYAMQL